MALGDKTIDYNFYGLVYHDLSIRRESNPDVYESNLIAKVVEKDTGYGYYLDPTTIPWTEKFNYGKELNDSVAIWKIPADCTFNHATFTVKNSDTLDFVCETDNPTQAVPVAMEWADIASSYGGFSTNPQNRLAYNYSSAYGYFNSVLVADFVYTAMCTTPGFYSYNRATNSTSGGPSLSTLASWIDTDPNNRDITGIRTTLFAGTEYPRRDQSVQTNTTPIPEFGTRPISPINSGVPYIDTLRPYPIPDNAPAIRTIIKDGHDDWEDTKIYAPFGFQPGRAWYDTENHDVSALHRIGFFRTYTVNDVTNGQSGHERGIFLRCNFNEKVFDDVCYKWELVCYYPSQNRYLENGFDLTTITGTDNLRFYTRLVITDQKGVSKGEATYRAVLHELAYLGLYFTKTGDLARNTDFTTANDLTNIFCPIFENGVTTGLYATGDEIKNLPNWNSSSVGDEVFHYNPGESDSDSGDLTTRFLRTTLGGSAVLWGFDDSMIAALATWLNTTYAPDDADFIADFKGTNPNDYIVSVKYFPYPLPLDSSLLQVAIGRITNTGFFTHKIPREIGGSSSLYDFGSWRLEPPYIDNDFRMNYTKLMLYIPWCGYTQLDTALFAPSPDGTTHTIGVKMSIDVTTGSCLGMVLRDGTVIQTINGTCGVDIPLTALTQGTYQNSIKQQEIALKQAETARLVSTLKLGGSVIPTITTGATFGLPAAAAKATSDSGNIISAALDNLSAVRNAEAVEYQLEHTAPSMDTVSGASPFNNILIEPLPKLFIYKPVMMAGYDASAYAKTVGYACNRSGILSTFRGLTVCATANLSSINCTASEQSMIASLLTSGVII